MALLAEHNVQMPSGFCSTCRGYAPYDDDHIEPIQLLPGQVVYNDPDGLLQAQKEEQPKKTAPRKRKLDSLSNWPGFQAVKR